MVVVEPISYDQVLPIEAPTLSSSSPFKIHGLVHGFSASFHWLSMKKQGYKYQVFATLSPTLINHFYSPRNNSLLDHGS
jgi:hypothetical protein